MKATHQRRVRRGEHAGHRLVSAAVVSRDERGRRSAYVVGRTVPSAAAVYARLDVARIGSGWVLIDPDGDPFTFRSVADALRWMAAWCEGALMARLDLDAALREGVS